VAFLSTTKSLSGCGHRTVSCGPLADIGFTLDKAGETLQKGNAGVVRTSASTPHPVTKSSEELMPAYAVAHMREVTMGPQIVEYLRRIDATLEPFAGRFLVHGGEVEVLEGAWRDISSSSSSQTANGRMRGINRARTREFCRCARTTPRAMSSSLMGFPKVIGRPMSCPSRSSSLD
jgi:hypothetical protein